MIGLVSRGCESPHPPHFPVQNSEALLHQDEVEVKWV